ncbi:eif-2Bepsilon, partial [Pristionchus pacificus]|uniref:Translation initiation factor eIF2B subunit epsilon n=1 Tax=Pristionchus pacificus TaxID=54126 RepID=A0A8R1V4I6_PRIPA
FSCKMPPKEDAKNQDAQRLSAVIIAESFEPRFHPITSDKSFGDLAICDVRGIDYSLRWLSRCDIANVVIVVSEKHAPAYHSIESLWKGVFDCVTLVICQNAHSIGDALREVESRNILTGHFLLVPSPISFCSSTLENQIKAFKQRFKKDRNAVMSLIYSESRGDGTCVAINENGRMMAFHSQSDPSQLDSETNEFRATVTIRNDVVDTGIAICSLQALAHFSDNFDFQTRDEVIRHILVNEDIMLQYVNVDVLPSFESAISVFDYSGLIRSNSQLISRLFFPLFPFKCNKNVLINSGNVITSGRQRVRIDGWNSFVGENVSVGTNVFVTSSSIAKKCTLESNCRIVESIVSEGSVIGEGVSLDQVFISNNVIIPKGQILPKKVVIGPNVKLNGSIKVKEGSFISCTPPDEDIEDSVETEKLFDGVYSWIGKTGRDWWSGEWIGREDDDGDDKKDDNKEKEGEEAEDEEGEYDVERVFTSEVLDSLRPALTDKISQETARQIIVEINSSKIAYNISMDRVAALLFVAFLRMPDNNVFSNLKKRMDNYIQILRNYYSNRDGQLGLLEGLNEHLSSNRESFSPLVAKTIHHLYEKDILTEESILGWHEDLEKNDPMIPLVKELIEWLEESDEEDEDEEE